MATLLSLKNVHHLQKELSFLFNNLSPWKWFNQRKGLYLELVLLFGASDKFLHIL